jgi:hypothetical protein
MSVARDDSTCLETSTVSSRQGMGVRYFLSRLAALEQEPNYVPRT